MLPCHFQEVVSLMRGNAVRYNTPVKLLEEQAKVSVSEVRCSGYIEESRINSLDETDVVFDFTNKRGALR